VWKVAAAVPNVCRGHVHKTQQRKRGSWSSNGNEITVARLMKEKFAVARITSEWLGWWDCHCVDETSESYISTQLMSFILNVILQKHLPIISCSL
jgi:hypothetical protein